MTPAPALTETPGASPSCVLLALWSRGLGHAASPRTSRGAPPASSSRAHHGPTKAERDQPGQPRAPASPSLGALPPPRGSFNRGRGVGGTGTSPHLASIALAQLGAVKAAGRLRSGTVAMPTPAHGEGLVATSWPRDCMGTPPHPIPPHPSRAQPVPSLSVGAVTQPVPPHRQPPGMIQGGGILPGRSRFPRPFPLQPQPCPQAALALEDPLLGELQGPPYPLHRAKRLRPIPQSPYNPPSGSPGGTPTEAGTTGATRAARGEARLKRAVWGVWGHGAHSWGGSTSPCPLPVRLGAVVGGLGGWEQSSPRCAPARSPSRAGRRDDRGSVGERALFRRWSPARCRGEAGGVGGGAVHHSKKNMPGVRYRQWGSPKG